MIPDRSGANERASLRFWQVWGVRVHRRENISIEQRYAEGEFEGLHALAVVLVRLKVDVLVVAGRHHARRGARRSVAAPISRFRNNPANVSRYGERRLGLRSQKTMTHYAKNSWSRYRHQVVADTIEQAIRDALPIGYTGHMIVKVSVDGGRVKVEVEQTE